MRRFVVVAVVLGGGMFTGVAFNRHCPGCVVVARVNTDCAWTADRQGPLDMRSQADAAHLAADAQLAEELAVRYADAAFARLYGYDGHGGIEGHARKQCMARLVSVIATDHAVTEEDIAAARARRNQLFDIVAATSFVPLYLGWAAFACGGVFRRVSPERGAPSWITLGLTSIPTTFLGLQLGQLWLGVWEAVRVRNGHISVFRAASRTIWTHEHVGWLVAGGMIGFAVVASLRRNTPVRDGIRIGSSFVGVMLAAIFADVFVEHVLGYALIGSVLLFLAFASCRESAAGAPELTTVLLR